MNTDKKAIGARARAELKPSSPKQKNFGQYVHSLRQKSYGKLKQKAMRSSSGMRTSKPGMRTSSGMR